jgi:WD40 repeat protein
VKPKRKIKEEVPSFWTRAPRVSPDAQHVALLYRGVALFNLPKLQQARGWTREGVGRCAAFITGENMFLVGKYNGDVQIYDYGNYMHPTQRQFLTRHTGRAEGVAMLPHDPIVITAGSEGRLNFTNWTDRSLLGSHDLPKATFTSLHLSPDGAFMSIGDSDASMSLWDLRVLHIPRLFTQPFAHTSPDHLVTINELAANPNLKKPVQRALTFIQKVLQYRFRFDIEIAEVPKIKVGEFDIEIE